MDKLKDLAGKIGHKGQGNSAADPNAPASNAAVGLERLRIVKFGKVTDMQTITAWNNQCSWLLAEGRLPRPRCR